MKVYLAGTSGIKDAFLRGEVLPSDCNILESFYTIQDWQTALIPQYRSFLLDSGAFTFLNSQKKDGRIDFNRYADSYADFIRDNKVKHYFELDIDGIVGLPEVERLRARIESRCGIPCIPVWHKGRGKDYFLQMCKEYRYVAIGGIVTQEIPKSTYEKGFPWFIAQAHEAGCGIHGLGYTNLTGLKRYRFDSVDSTTWTMGSRFGQVMQYKNGTIVKHNSVNGGIKTRSIKNIPATTIHNFKEWLKYSKYMDKYHEKQ